jgi:hypothetical protein
MPAHADIHVLLVTASKKEGVDGRDIGERSDAVLRTAMPGHDGAWRMGLANVAKRNAAITPQSEPARACP